MLQEKSPLSELQQDSGHCSLDTQDMLDVATMSGSITPGGTTPHAQRAIRHQRIVKINGNDYAHIWESPLPEPCGAGASCRLCPRDPRDPMGRNTVYVYRCKPEDLCNMLTLKHAKLEGGVLEGRPIAIPVVPPGVCINPTSRAGADISNSGSGSMSEARCGASSGDTQTASPAPPSAATCGGERTLCSNTMTRGGTAAGSVNERVQNLQNNSYEAPRYSSLERNGRYGNSSSSV